MTLGKFFYMPGFTNWAFESISLRPELRPLQNGMDGTRIIRIIELYRNRYLVGEEFNPDVRLFQDQILEADSLPNIQSYVLQVRKKMPMLVRHTHITFLTHQASTLMSCNTGSIPEAKSGVTGNHILAQMLEVEKRSYNLPLIGHCTDSAANALKGLIMLASPHTFTKNLTTEVKYIGLPINGYCFFAPILRPPYPSIAFPCWDHSGRTVVRNLMNQNITIVSEKLPGSKDGLPDSHHSRPVNIETTVPRCKNKAFRHYPPLLNKIVMQQHAF